MLTKGEVVLSVLTAGETLQSSQRPAAILLSKTDIDVTPLAFHVLVTKFMYSICRRVYTYGGGSDHTIVHRRGRDDPVTGLEMDDGAECKLGGDLPKMLTSCTFMRRWS